MRKSIWRPRSLDTSKPTCGLTFTRRFTHDARLDGGGEALHTDATRMRVSRLLSEVTKLAEAVGADGDERYQPKSQNGGVGGGAD